MLGEFCGACRRIPRRFPQISRFSSKSHAQVAVLLSFGRRPAILTTRESPDW